jgi:hypothetical protein
MHLHHMGPAVILMVIIGAAVVLTLAGLIASVASKENSNK